MKLNPEHMDADGVRERVKNQRRKNMRSSDVRRRFLQKYARIISGVHGTKLQFGPIACVDMESGDPVITIPAEEFDQPVTEYDRNVFNLMMQETLTIHEIAHIIYTNYRSFKRYYNKLEEPDTYLFKEIWNALEDGAIEQQIRYAFSVGDELDVMNANFTKDAEYGTEQSNGDIVYTMHEAVTTALMDLAIFDSGNFSKIIADSENHRLCTPQDQDIFEDFVPKIQSVTKDVLTESSSKERNRRIYQFFEEVQDLLDEAQIDGRQEKENEAQGGEQGHPIPGMPDDTQGHTGEEEKDAYMLGASEQEEDVEGQVSSGMPGDEEEEEGPGSGSRGEEEDGEEEGGGTGDEDEDHGKDISTDPELEEEYEEELQNEWEQQAKEQDGVQEEIQEAVKFLEAIDGGTSSSNSDWDPSQVELEIPEPRNEYIQARYDEARKKAKSLEDILRARLQSEKESKMQRNKRRGGFDSKRMIPAAMGSTRVFEQEIELDKKDYDCVIVYDRSGSMSGRDKPLEIAGGMLAKALNSVGVNTSVIGLHHGEARLELPFGAPVESKRGLLFSGDTGGGTPLSKAIFLARHRLMQERSQPFMIVVTDGMPDNRSRYKDELMKCTFPVVGVYVNTNESAEDMTEYFHRVANVSGDNLDLKLKRLVQQVMF